MTSWISDYDKVIAIASRVAEHSGDYSLDQLLGYDRHLPLVWHRQVAMFAVRSQTRCSHPEIARIFGGRDHTTVIHAVRKIAGELDRGLGRTERAVAFAIGPVEVLD